MMNFDIPSELSNKSGIYIIKNSINNKVYIGSAIIFSRRFRQHKHLILSKKHNSKHLNHHVSKYGIESLSFGLLEVCAAGELLQREQYYLDLYDPFKGNGFNTSRIAGFTIGYKHTDASRSVMSEKKKGKKPPANATENARKYWSGRKHSPETYVKMIAAQANKTYDEAARKNMSLAHLGKKQSQETKDKRAAALRGVTKNGDIVLNQETGIFYESIKDAAKTMYYSHSSLHRKVTGRRINNTPFIKI